MKLSVQPRLIVVFDDREFVTGELLDIVGRRRYGDIILNGRRLVDRLSDLVPRLSSFEFFHLKSDQDKQELNAKLEVAGEAVSVCFISSRCGVATDEVVQQFLLRLPYAEGLVASSNYKPLILFFKNGRQLLQNWEEMISVPFHLTDTVWHDVEVLQSFVPRDLGILAEFLSFSTGSTKPRHFNEIEVSNFEFLKRSKDQKKIQSEFNFFYWCPPRMQSWLVQPYDYFESVEFASYKTKRQFTSDAALQWVHCSFDKAQYLAFLSMLLFFLQDRPATNAKPPEVTNFVNQIFLEKVEKRVSQFLATKEGRKINALASASFGALELQTQFERYKELLKKNEHRFKSKTKVIGHGDPCLSNILYDKRTQQFKLIDPRGAKNKDQLWSHPLYDVCKFSHSILGDYDFITNGQYGITLDTNNKLKLDVRVDNVKVLQDQKSLFVKKIEEIGYDPVAVRLGEASLFLSMLPLHLDEPNRVLAFLISANRILDEIADG